MLTGFILGSLAVIWPWKYSYDTVGNLVEANKFGALVNTDVKIISYERILPHIDGMFFIAIIIAILGFLSIYLLEKKAINMKE